MTVGSNVTVRNLLSQLEVTVEVVHVDDVGDWILLRAGHTIVLRPCELSIATYGEDCCQVGLSAFDGGGARMENYFVDKGVIGSTQVDQNGHIQATPGANSGDSGGGCFSTDLPLRFLGMIVGNRNPCEINLNTGLKAFFHPARTLLVPATSIVPILQSLPPPITTPISGVELGKRMHDGDEGGSRAVHSRTSSGQQGEGIGAAGSGSAAGSAT